MPEWIHNRAQHLMSKNPDMQESTAWAVATQQAHAAGKSPKGYGTAEGKREAKKKFDKPKKEYVQTANPTKTAGAVSYALDAAKNLGRKVTNADAIADMSARLAQQEAAMAKVKGTMRNTALVGGGTAIGGGAVMAANKDKQAAAEAIDGYSLAVFAGFSDEMQKMAGPMGEALKRFGNLVAGGAKKDIIHTQEIPRGRIAKFFGAKPKQITSIMEGAGPRVGSGMEALKNPATRSEALKVLGARGAAGAGVVGAGTVASQKHTEHTNERLGRAYMAGARDMYAQSSG